VVRSILAILVRLESGHWQVAASGRALIMHGPYPERQLRSTPIACPVLAL